MKNKLLLTMIFVTAISFYAYADDAADIERASREIDQEAKEQGNKTVEEKIKQQYGVNDRVIKNLRDQNMGYGEIDTTLGLASQMDGGVNNENVRRIAAMRTGDDKKGWGQITKELGVKMGDIKGNKINADRRDLERRARDSRPDVERRALDPQRRDIRPADRVSEAPRARSVSRANVKTKNVGGGKK